MTIVILLQSGKGGMGAIGGGGTSTGSVFGGAGAGSFLNKLTAYLAIAFIGLSVVLVKSSSKEKSTLKAAYAGKSTKGAITEHLKDAGKKDAKKVAKKDAKKVAKKDVKKKEAKKEIKKDTKKKDVKKDTKKEVKTDK